MIDSRPRQIQPQDMPSQRNLGDFESELAVFVPETNSYGVLISAIPGRVESTQAYSSQELASKGLVKVLGQHNTTLGRTSGQMHIMDINHAGLVPVDLVPSLVGDSEVQSEWLRDAVWPRAHNPFKYMQLLGLAYERLIENPEIAANRDPRGGNRHSNVSTFLHRNASSKGRLIA